jgi:hypothetical protein
VLKIISQLQYHNYKKEDHLPSQYTAQPKGSDGQIFQHSYCILNNASSEVVCKACKYHNT